MVSVYPQQRAEHSLSFRAPGLSSGQQLEQVADSESRDAGDPGNCHTGYQDNSLQGSQMT